jgi:hypothetical protein
MVLLIVMTIIHPHAEPICALAHTHRVSDVTRNGTQRRAFPRRSAPRASLRRSARQASPRTNHYDSVDAPGAVAIASFGPDGRHLATVDLAVIVTIHDA